MAITALNDYAIGDVNFNTMMTTLDKTYKGKAEITLSEYDTTAAPDVKVGSVFENNGALFIVDTTDITPTGYSGISVSTTFYLYYDESATAFIFNSTAPTWSDTLQGWYNGNDRAFFSMYKDSGGTLYESKLALDKLAKGIDAEGIFVKTKIIEIGDWDMDSTATKTIAHGLSDFKKVRLISASIRKDDDTELYFLHHGGTAVSAFGYIYADSTNINLVRAPAGFFDSTDFNSTSYNRGWVDIIYES